MDRRGPGSEQRGNRNMREGREPWHHDQFRPKSRTKRMRHGIEAHPQMPVVKKVAMACSQEGDRDSGHGFNRAEYRLELAPHFSLQER